MELTTGLQIKEYPSNQNEFNLLHSASSFTFVATILNALIVNGNVYKQKELVIYVVGVELEYTYILRNHLCMFINWLPNVNIYNILFIGPEMNVMENTYNYIIEEKTSNINIEFHRCLFEDLKTDKNPNIIVCYHPGFGACSPIIDVWKMGVESMFKFKNIPILFTAFSIIESLDDTNYFMRLCKKNKISVKMILKTQRNQYRDFRPLRNMVFDSEEPIYFINNYITLLQLH